MGSTPDSEAEALDRRLMRVLEHLVESENHRGVVRLVERWSERGKLPLEVVRAQARALISLRLMDRAWVRLREAAELDSSDSATQLLTAEMFIERGWPARARRILERVQVADVDARQLDRLRQAAAQPPLQPPESAQDIERTGDPGSVLELAERYMAAGSFVRAQSLLERLHRQGRGGSRVADLLWAIQGDFGSGKLPLEDLIDELSPEARLSEWEGIELTESLQAREETHHDPEAAARELLAAGEPKEDAPPAFPDLFRRGEMHDDTTLHDDDEVTVASSMATPDQMGDRPLDVHTDPGVSVTGDGGDTRIMEVIGQEYVPLDPAKPIHRPADPMVSAGSEVGSTLDLRSYRDSMGMDGLSADAETFLEEEDQDLIVMTRREGRTSSPPVGRTVPNIEVVEKGVSGLRRPKPARPSEPEAAVVHDSRPAEAPVRRKRWVQLAVWGGTLALGMILVGWVVLYGLHQVAGRQVIEDTHSVLASGHFRAIQELEAKLNSEVKVEREPFEVRVVELALAKVVLWAEYTGDSDRLAAAEEALAWAELNGGAANEMALARGFLSLTRGDLVSAQAEADRVKADEPLGRALVARVALARGQRASLEAAWTRIGGAEAVDGPMFQVLALEALAAGLGEVEVMDAARARLLELDGDNALVQLARFEERWDKELPAAQALVDLAAAKDEVRGALSPRQAGRFHMMRSRLASAIGLDKQARDARQSALVEDPNHPRYLYRAALEAVHQNRLVAGEDDLRRCLEARPWDRACRRGTVQVLIDLDRVQTARARVEGFRGPGVDVAHLEAWITLAEGRPQDALDALGARGREGGVAAYVESMARADLNVPEADAGLVAVVQDLEVSEDLMDRILAGRAEAARMRFVQKNQLAEVEAKAVRLAPSDPGVHVLLGQYSEAKGRRGDAADAYDLAARLGVESAWAHHARGLFYFDPRGDMTQAKSAWNRYLTLQPDGVRAERTKERMRLR